MDNPDIRRLDNRRSTVLEGMNYEVIAKEPVLSDLTNFMPDVANASSTDASNLTNVVLSDVESTSSTALTYFVPGGI